MRVVWLTDLHLNFVSGAKLLDFRQTLRAARPDAVLLSGDIAEADDVASYLDGLSKSVDCPIYFVLGNHDFYFGSIHEVRTRVAELCARAPNLRYLTMCEPLELTPRIGLVGHDGWADGRVGDYERSTVMMNDYRLIAELAGVGKRERWPLLQSLAQEAADHLRRVLPAALTMYPEVFLVTHVPPLREACWHEGHLSDDEWAPHFVSLTVGEALLDIMRQHPEGKLTVLCGHTHGSGECQPLPNVTILTGGAAYGSPGIVRVFEL
jgi:3',5'-cyclic AMP phosphodiesterase CpdA